MPGKVATTAKGLDVPPLAVVLVVVLLCFHASTISTQEDLRLRPFPEMDSQTHSVPSVLPTSEVFVS